MENDLVSIYENNYLRGSIVEENRAGKADINKNGKIEPWEAARDKAIKKNMNGDEHDDDEDEEDEDETHDEAVKRKMKKIKKSRKSMKTKKSNINPGEIYGDSFKRSDNIFDQILREMDEMGGGNMNSSSDTNNVFNADEEMGGEEESYTLSELKSMTLGELMNLLASEDEGEYEDEGEDYQFNGEVGEDESIPAESYGFTGGEGNYMGDQNTYDGKAKRANRSTFIKDNGDADFSDSDTGYDPDDTEGSEGSEHGAQGQYDGKAKKSTPTNFVKGNGDADFGKTKTGYKTSSGKKDKNYF